MIEKADSISLRHPLMQQISKRINTYKAVAVGKIFQDVIAVNMQDQPSRLSDYAGKGEYVLIDFWASCCKPCCIEMPELKQLYHQIARRRVWRLSAYLLIKTKMPGKKRSRSYK